MALTENVTVSVTADTKGVKKSCHEMSMCDIKNIFKANFCDEIHDSNEYHDMAKAAEILGDEELARGLYAMSHDEYTHAKFIHDNLVDWGCEIPEKERMEWHELCERMSRYFRD